MKKTLLNILLMILLGTSIFAQPSLEWVRTLGGTGVDFPVSIKVDNFDNTYISGRFEGVVDFDPGPGVLNLSSEGGNDTYIQKLDLNGNLLWAKSFGGFSNDYPENMTLDLNGNIYITGGFSSTVDFDPGANVYNLSSNGYFDIYVLKLDLDGNFLWAKSFGSDKTALNDHGKSITTDIDGNVIIAGHYQDTVDFDPGSGIYNLICNQIGSYDVFVQKLDPNGNFLWAKSFGNSNTDNVSSLATTINNEIVLTGNFAGTLDIDPNATVVNLTSNGSTDIYILKLDQNGSFVWANRIGGNAGDGGNSIVTDNIGNIYSSGYFSNIIDLDPGSSIMNFASNGSIDIYIQKLDPNGNFIWGRTMGGAGADTGRAIDVDGAFNVYTSGSYSNTIDLDPGSGSMNFSSNGLIDVFIQKLDVNGDFIWAESFGGVNNESGYSIDIFSNSQIYLAGYFNDVVDFEPGLGTQNLSSNGLIDIFIQKFSDCSPSNSTQNHTACSSYTWNGTTYNSTGTYTYTTANAAGCDSTATLNLTIEDVTAPVANVATLTNVNSECSITTLTAPTATDNCSGTITGTHNATLPITSQGTTVVTWTYNDGNGNTSTQTQNVVIDDVTAPVANVATLTNVTSECSITTLTAPSASDNCAGTITGTHNATLPITSQGTTVVTWTYNDGNGNTSTQTQSLIIDDVTAPVADVATLANITAECSVMSLTTPTATDNCAGTIAGTHNATLPITTQGTTVVTWTYDDGNGNTSTQTQNVIIDDVTAPIADVATLANITAECSVMSLTAPTATDNCAGIITGTHNTTLPITSQGTTVVIWTYNDGNGNTSTQTQNVIISGPNVAVTQVDEITLSADLTGADYQWIDCDNGNQILNGETNQTFVATSNGSYAVIVDNGNCSDTSTCVAITTVGFDENLSTELVKVYPNPTNGAFTIDLMEQNDQVSIRLINSLGQIIQEEHFELTDKINLNINSQPGIYFLEGQINQTQQFRINIIKQ